jgi:hypothetical protein
MNHGTVAKVIDKAKEGTTASLDLSKEVVTLTDQIQTTNESITLIHNDTTAFREVATTAMNSLKRLFDRLLVAVNKKHDLLHNEILDIKAVSVNPDVEEARIVAQVVKAALLQIEKHRLTMIKVCDQLDKRCKTCIISLMNRVHDLEQKIIISEHTMSEYQEKLHGCFEHLARLEAEHPEIKEVLL